MNPLLKNAMILDTETTGLKRGSGVFELSILDIAEGALHERHLDANLVLGQYDQAQETTHLATRSTDVHKHLKAKDWAHVISSQYQIGSDRLRQGDLSELKVANPFLAQGIEEGKYGVLGVGENLTTRREALGKLPGVRSASVARGSVEEVLGEGGLLHKSLQKLSKEGGILWGANVPFESKMLGAQLGALDQGLEDAGKERRHVSAIKKVLETRTTSADPLYVTGAEVTSARTQAQMTGDWTGVWKAYKQYTPKAGEVAVRDIQDVLRAQTTYAHKLGLTGIKDAYTGTSMDLVSRLFGSLHQDPDVAKRLLGTAETHRASEDVITELDVLRKTLAYTEALQQAHEKTDLGLQYLDQLDRGEGPLADVGAYYKRLEAVMPELQKSTLASRLSRAQEDFWEKGATYQKGDPEIYDRKLSTPRGEVTTTGLSWGQEKYDTWEDLTAHLETEQRKTGRYSELNIREEVSAFRTHMGDSKDKAKLTEYTEQFDSRKVYEGLGERADELLALKAPKMGMAGKAARGVLDAMGQMSPKGIAGVAVAGAGVLTAMGAAASVAGAGKVEKQNQSVVSFNYYDWLARQQQQVNQADFSGSRGVNQHMEGMGHGGMAGQTRSMNTDFGSPYIGIAGSQMVFHDQELLQEREKWLRNQYANVHFDPDRGLFGIGSAFKAAMPKPGYSYIPGGEVVGKGEFQSLKGNLKKINLSDRKWKVSVDDADTITVKRGGIRGAVGSFFGMNRGYSFRMAGIDAPETHHGSTSYHAPQPGAEAATTIFKNMVHGANKLTLVYDPENTTYGRMMGAVIADGKNLNFELVKQGAVTHLPFGKSYKSMIDYQSLGKAEQAAHAASRGIWAEPYYKAFYDITKSKGERYTLNTLTRKSRIVENISTMDALSLMEQAQSQGIYTPTHAAEAASIGYEAKSRGADYVKPFFLDRTSSHYEAYMGEMMRDIGHWNKTNGTGHIQNKFRSRGGYGKLDKSLALDTMGSTNNIFNRRRFAAFDHYNQDKQRTMRRRSMQAATQRAANHSMFRSPTNHHEMQ